MRFPNNDFSVAIICIGSVLCMIRLGNNGKAGCVCVKKEKSFFFSFLSVLLWRPSCGRMVVEGVEEGRSLLPC